MADDEPHDSTPPESDQEAQKFTSLHPAFNAGGRAAHDGHVLFPHFSLGREM
jgi:hypothetical protein